MRERPLRGRDVVPEWRLRRQARARLSAAEVLGVKPAHCMHIGDRPDRDIDPANQAGWLTVLNRRTGRYHERPGQTPPAHVIHNFWDLIEIFDKSYEPAV